MPEKEIVRFTLDPDFSVQEMRFLQRLAQFADQTKDRHAAAYGVQDLLQSLNTCHLISDDSLQKIQKVVRKMGVRPEKYRDVFMPADEKSPRSEDVLRFQMEVLDLYHRDYVVQSTLKEVQGAEEVDVEKTVEFFRTSHLSLPQLHTLTYYTDETFYGYGEFRHYQAAMRSLGTGQSLEVARTQAESELDAIDDSWARRYPVLRGGDMETVLLLSAVKGREPVWEGEQKAEALRAIQAYLSHGTAPAAYLKGVRRVEQGSLFGG